MIFEQLSLYFLIFFLATIQSVVGVGILVLGTPILLILEFRFYDILSFLLPISIFTSFINYLYFTYKKKIFIKIDALLIKIFFFGTIPSVFLGILILKIFENNIDFKILIGLVIALSIYISSIKNLIKKINKLTIYLFLLLTGIVHGITNSGGTILSIFFNLLNNKNETRYNLTFFYFFLALTQFLLFISIFEINFNFKVFLTQILIAFLASLFGYYLFKYLSEELFKNLIKVLSIIACVTLLIN